LGALDRSRRRELDELRERAGTQFETYGPQLADRLLLTCQRLRSSDNPEEALQLAQEAVRVRRSLAKEQNSFDLGLAYALLLLGFCLAEVGAAEEAIDVLRECVEMTAEAPNSLRTPASILRSNALERLSLLFGETDRVHEAVRTADEAITGYRAVYGENPRVAPELARALHNLATLLASAGRRVEALAFLEEALSIFDCLSAQGDTAPVRDWSRAQQLHTVLTAGDRKSVDVSGDALFTYQQAVETDPYSVTTGLRGMAAHVEISPIEPSDAVAMPHREQKSMGMTENRIDLTDAVQAVRDDLREAIISSGDEYLQFEMEGIELEFTIELTRDPTARSGVRTLVVMDDTGGKVAGRSGERHRLRLTLSPRQVGSVRIGIAP
jgi:tetratricopeptide (TPR) repeat protein